MCVVSPNAADAAGVPAILFLTSMCFQQEFDSDSALGSDTCVVLQEVVLLVAVVANTWVQREYDHKPEREHMELSPRAWTDVSR